jgi:hypothetical protein
MVKNKLEELIKGTNKQVKDILTINPKIDFSLDGDVSFDFGLKVDLPDFSSLDAMGVLNKLLMGAVSGDGGGARRRSPETCVEAAGSNCDTCSSGPLQNKSHASAPIPFSLSPTGQAAAGRNYEHEGQAGGDHPSVQGAGRED